MGEDDGGGDWYWSPVLALPIISIDQTAKEDAEQTVSHSPPSIHYGEFLRGLEYKSLVDLFYQVIEDHKSIDGATDKKGNWEYPAQGIYITESRYLHALRKSIEDVIIERSRDRPAEEDKPRIVEKDIREETEESVAIVIKTSEDIIEEDLKDLTPIVPYRPPSESLQQHYSKALKRLDELKLHELHEEVLEDQHYARESPFTEDNFKIYPQADIMVRDGQELELLVECIEDRIVQVTAETRPSEKSIERLINDMQLAYNTAHQYQHALKTLWDLQQPFFYAVPFVYRLATQSNLHLDHKVGNNHIVIDPSAYERCVSIKIDKSSRTNHELYLCPYNKEEPGPYSLMILPMLVMGHSILRNYDGQGKRPDAVRYLNKPHSFFRRIKVETYSPYFFFNKAMEIVNRWPEKAPELIEFMQCMMKIPNLMEDVLRKRKAKLKSSIKGLDEI